MRRPRTPDERRRAQDAARTVGLTGDADIDRVIAELLLPELHQDGLRQMLGEIYGSAYVTAHVEQNAVNWAEAIEASSTDPVTFVALVHAAAKLLRHHRAPPELSAFAAYVLDGARVQPSVRITEVELRFRDLEVVEAVRREVARGATVKVACERVAQALLELGLKPTSARVVAAIWRRRHELRLTEKSVS